ncbi:hypothetical protein PPL_09364 [Heterostelium album PN500]|uniref:Uncharacterized protein n=1 Tax=Heterostelium pallidum (strain ATCC 26659 / Pp 5 / PN500) TaxID=670386 RepID=D3BLD0_HETP5|nr:hypothetical protein PPL_09364 [Heterostelium album PN500]EFA77864.1 hypothetical protein PPL_09364 [Heterostelium album PN500]|eukprot:XP_020429992.1 hypothetical protein PPL_09364 [Heterostelium album PN500]
MTIEDGVKDILKKIVKVWDELGVENNYRVQQCDQASQQVINLYNNLLKKEEKYKDDVIKEILAGLESICSMSTELGETVKDTNKPLANMNLLQRSSYIESQLSTLRKRTEDRVALIEDLEATIEDISKELELKDLNQSHMNESDINGNDYSMEKISSLQKKLKKLQVQRNEAFIKVKQLCLVIVELWTELRIAPDTEFELSIVKMSDTNEGKSSPISLCLATITVLSQKIDKLQIIKKENEAMVTEYAQKITILWDKLEVPEDERESFFAKTAGLGMDVVEACQEELYRVEELRRASLSELIERCKANIVEIYSIIHWPLERIDELVEDTLDGSEEHLELLEAEEDRARQVYEISKPLITLIEKREEIRNSKIEYEQTVLGDKERLLSKKFDRGRFIQEEKLRKAIQKLPAVEEKLRKELVEWQKTHGEPFAYDGFDYLDLMDQQADNDRIKRDLEKMRKDKEKQSKLNDDSHKLGGNGAGNGGANSTAAKKLNTVAKTPVKSSAASTAASKTVGVVGGPTTPSTPRNVSSLFIKKQQLQAQQSTSSQTGNNGHSEESSMVQSPFVERIGKKRAPLSPISNQLNGMSAGGNISENGHVVKKKIVTIQTNPVVVTGGSTSSAAANNLLRKKQLASSPLKNTKTTSSTTSVKSTLLNKPKSTTSSKTTTTSSSLPKLPASLLQQPLFNHDQSIVCHYQYDNEDLIMNEEI